MTTFQLIVSIFGIIMLIPTIASLTKFDQWWVRGFDFPRVQISFLILLAIVFCIEVYSFEKYWQIVLVALLMLSFLYQAVKIFPYTILAKKQVLKFQGSDDNAIISILISNVLSTNIRFDKLIEHVNKYKPDILLTLETDQRWEDELAVIEDQYPYTVKVPKDNFYGMHLYSKLKLEDIDVKYIITEEIPSIHGYIRMNNGVKIKLHCLHPKPPSPTEDDTSTNRDAELLFVGRDVKKDQESVLLIGDLNDVAWSRTTKLFREISGLLDPRIGRGFYNTYHTGYAMFRWPLDHVFHTNDFTLVEITRLKSINSDHFPMYIKLNFEPRAELLQDKPEEADEDEKKWADEKIENGNPRYDDV